MNFCVCQSYFNSVTNSWTFGVLNYNMKSCFLKLIKFLIILLLFLIVYTPLKDVFSTKSVAIIEGVHLNIHSLQYSIDRRKVIAENTQKENKLKYILQWTSDTNVPFVDMGKGQKGFVTRNCSYINCFVTSNKSYLDDYTKFDVVAFSGTELSDWEQYDIKKPKRRYPHQKYVFGTIEAADNYPICTYEYEEFFNWTWTYKLDSEIQWGYIVVRDVMNNIIGPRKDMNWLKPDEMIPISDAFKNKLMTKRRAAAWFASNCNTLSHREQFVRELQVELNKYKCGGTMCTIDIYGDCGPFVCSLDHEDQCDKNIEITYYFYLAFENTFNEDYVTEKLLRALNNDAVPIVYGGANYSRFMPEGAFLNAWELQAKKLAAKMSELIDNPEVYATYFKWKNHYSYHKTTASPDTSEYCKFCALLNDEKSVSEVSVYKNFKDWWNSPGVC